MNANKFTQKSMEAINAAQSKSVEYGNAQLDVGIYFMPLPPSKTDLSARF